MEAQKRQLSSASTLAKGNEWVELERHTAGNLAMIERAQRSSETASRQSRGPAGSSWRASGRPLAVFFLLPYATRHIFSKAPRASSQILFDHDSATSGALASSVLKKVAIGFQSGCALIRPVYGPVHVRRVSFSIKGQLPSSIPSRARQNVQSAGRCHHNS